MRTRIITLLMCFISLNAFSQAVIDSANFAPHKDYYIMPSSFIGIGACAPFMPYANWATTFLEDVNHYVLDNNNVEYEEHVYVGGTIHIAIPYTTDTALTIRGIAMYTEGMATEGEYDYDMDIGVIQIRDSNMNLLVSRTVTTMDEEIGVLRPDFVPNYLEFFFDSSVTVMGTYYVIQYGSFQPFWLLNPDCYSMKTILVGTGYYYEYPQTWIPFNEADISFFTGIGDETVDCMNFRFADIYTFPIYQPTNSSLDNPSNIETSLYPNPAKDVLNITSKERMQRVQVFNMMGQMIREEELSSNSAVLDIKGLKQGSYIAKILFNSGVTAQKFVVE